MAVAECCFPPSYLCSPMHSFATGSSRDKAGKVFISSHHTSVEMKGRTAPLGTYKVPGAFDKQVCKTVFQASTRTWHSFPSTLLRSQSAN